jgi:hypothetical protein
VKQFRLRHELRVAGASRQEARELAQFVRSLPTDRPMLSRERKNAIAADIGFKMPSPLSRHRMVLASGFATLLLISAAALAQAALPGTKLYALKRGTENVRVLVQPGYRQEVVERRKDELNELRKVNASKESVHEAEEAVHESVEELQESKRSGADDSKSGGGSSGSGSSSGSSGTSDESKGSGSGNSGSSDSSGSDSNTSGSSGSGKSSGGSSSSGGRGGSASQSRGSDDD